MRQPFRISGFTGWNQVARHRDCIFCDECTAKVGPNVGAIERTDPSLNGLRWTVEASIFFCLGWPFSHIFTIMIYKFFCSSFCKDVYIYIYLLEFLLLSPLKSSLHLVTFCFPNTGSPNKETDLGTWTGQEGSLQRSNGDLENCCLLLYCVFNAIGLEHELICFFHLFIGWNHVFYLWFL